MAKRISPTRVGGFVLAALLLVAVAIAILGGSDLFNVKDRCIIYFEDSVKGLYVGSAVTFRGVEIGRVTSISLIYNASNNNTLVPVVVDLEPNRVVGIHGNKDERERLLQTMIDQGLRAQLAPDSLLANTEIIQLDFFPSTPAVLHPNSTAYIQIPSLPSTLQQLQAELAVAIQKLPQIGDTLNASIRSLGQLFSPENRRHMSAIIANTDTITAAIAAHQNEIGDAITRLDQTTQQLSGIATSLNQIVSKDRAPLEAAIVNLNRTAISAHKLADQLDAMLAEDRAGLKQFSNGTLYQISGLVVDTRRMVHRANDTIDALDRDPSRFLFSSKTQGIPAK